MRYNATLFLHYDVDILIICLMPYVDLLSCPPLFLILIYDFDSFVTSHRYWDSFILIYDFDSFVTFDGYWDSFIPF